MAEEKKMCEYGCGRQAHYQMKNGKWCCQPSYNSCPQVRRKNVEGLKKAYASGKRNAKGVYQQLSQEKKNRMAWSRGKNLFSYNEIFCSNSQFSHSTLKKYLLIFKIKNDQCEKCGINKWNNQPISLQIHHKDGNPSNNVVENLQILCPNCHSQTETFSGRNKVKFNWNKVTQERLKEQAKKYNNYRQLLLSIGCFSIGKIAYTKLKQLLKLYNITLKEKKKRENHCRNCGKKISNSAKQCKKCAAIQKQFTIRKVKRPDKETLEREIAGNSFLALGRKYGVSDNAIRKWCKGYGLSFKKRV